MSKELKRYTEISGKPHVDFPTWKYLHMSAGHEPLSEEIIKFIHTLNPSMTVFKAEKTWVLE